MNCVYGLKHYFVFFCHAICWLYYFLICYLHFLFITFSNLKFGEFIGEGFPAEWLGWWWLGWWLQWWWRIAIAHWWSGPFYFLCGFNQRQVEPVTLHSHLNRTLSIDVIVWSLPPFCFSFQIQPCKHQIHWGSRTLRRHLTFTIRPLPMVLPSMLNRGEWKLKRKEWRRQQLLLLLKILMSCWG